MVVPFHACNLLGGTGRHYIQILLLLQRVSARWLGCVRSSRGWTRVFGARVDSGVGVIMQRRWSARWSRDPGTGRGGRIRDMLRKNCFCQRDCVRQSLTDVPLYWKKYLNYLWLPVTAFPSSSRMPLSYIAVARDEILQKTKFFFSLLLLEIFPWESSKLDWGESYKNQILLHEFGIVSRMNATTIFSSVESKRLNNSLSTFE